MTYKPLISIVVLGYNNFDRTTGPCLNSLRSWIGLKDFEFIVFDNASPDGSGEKTRQWCQEHPEIIFHASDQNLGYAAGMNEAASKATGRWLLLVNNDTEFPKNALDALKKSILNAPSNVAMIGPITNAAGNGQRLYDPQKNKENWLHLGEWLNNNPTGLYIDTYRCDFFCVAIENDTWKKLNGLDTIFGQGYYEDFDFSLRLKKIGVKQAITEDVFIYHQGSATFTGSPNQKELIKRNKKIIIKRHRNVIFQHARNCNYLIIKEYPQYSSEAISIRRDLRKKGLIMDMPKSWGKKMLWKLKIRKIKNQK